VQACHANKNARGLRKVVSAVNLVGTGLRNDISGAYLQCWCWRRSGKRFIHCAQAIVDANEDASGIFNAASNECMAQCRERGATLQLQLPLQLQLQLQLQLGPR
jgi:hypothetical protein